MQPALGRRTSWSYSLSPSVRERSSPPGPTLRYVALFVPVFRCSFNSPWLVFIDKHSSQRTDHYLRHLQQRLDYPDPLLFLTHLTCALRIHNRFFFSLDLAKSKVVFRDVSKRTFYTSIYRAVHWDLQQPEGKRNE